MKQFTLVSIEAARVFTTEKIEQDVQDTMEEIRERHEKMKEYRKNPGPLTTYRLAILNKEIAIREEFVRILNIILDERKGVNEIIHSSPFVDREETAYSLYGRENIHLFI